MVRKTTFRLFEQQVRLVLAAHSPPGFADGILVFLLLLSFQSSSKGKSISIVGVLKNFHIVRHKTNTYRLVQKLR